MLNCRAGSPGNVAVMTSPTVDDGPDEVEVALFAYEVAKVRAGAVTAAMVHLGDRLGLYRALADQDHPVTSAELADAAGLVERWVREWLYNQAAAGLVLIDDAERFSLSAAGAVVLADPDHEANLAGMFHSLPQTMQRLERLPDSFRTGVGYDYDAHGPDGAIGIERTFEPWMRAHLITDVVPLLDGVVARLQAGAAVADIGCGSGGSCSSWPPPSRPATSSATRSPVSPSSEPKRGSPSGGWPTSSSATAANIQYPMTDRSTSSPPATASTT